MAGRLRDTKVVTCTQDFSVPPDQIVSITTFNVASLRAAWRQGFEEYMRKANPDIICLQETKMSPTATPSIETMSIRGYHSFFLHAKKPGYSGTAVYTKYKPISVKKSAGISDENGRCMTVEFEKFYLVNTYVVNAGEDCKNLQTKMSTFLPELKAHIESLLEKKPVIWTGDLNVAHQEIDIWSPKGHDTIAGFTKQERTWFGDFLKTGWVDVFRELYPDRQQFSFFNFRGNEKAKNRGWRIDYFLMPKTFMDTGVVYDCYIEQNVEFSDHCPVTLQLDKAKIFTEADQLVSADTKSAVDICAKKSVSLLDFVKKKE